MNFCVVTMPALHNRWRRYGSIASRQLQISQEEIGYLCSTSRQRANQALQLLERRGLPKVEYGGVTILDMDGLRSFNAA